VHRAGRVCVAVQGKPLWPESPPNANPAVTVLAAYSKHGRAFLERLEGSFALAVVDEAAGSVLLAIDRMGIERMAWTAVGATLAFGSSAEHLARLPAVSAPVRRQGLYDFLMMHMIPAPDTIYEGVHKLRPATALTFVNGRAEVSTYWRPHFVERRAESFETLRDELHSSLDAAIRETRPNGTTGSFLSGGLDSSTVSGKLDRRAGAARSGQAALQMQPLGLGIGGLRPTPCETQNSHRGTCFLYPQTATLAVSAAPDFEPHRTFEPSASVSFQVPGCRAEARPTGALQVGLQPDIHLA
jgi:hypothetical protein